jgi:hypothetical protein
MRFNVYAAHVRPSGRRPDLDASELHLVTRADGLDITQDQYAYTASSTSLRQLIPEKAFDGGHPKFLELLAQPLQATKNGTPLPNVISISYGVCEASVKPYTAARKLFNRQLAATSSLGITTVVAAGDSGFVPCYRRGSFKLVRR